MTIHDNPQIGRLLSSKDHKRPIYFDGESFTDIEGITRFDRFRSDGDFFTVPVFIDVDRQKKSKSESVEEKPLV